MSGTVCVYRFLVCKCALLAEGWKREGLPKTGTSGLPIPEINVSNVLLPGAIPYGSHRFD